MEETFELVSGAAYWFCSLDFKPGVRVTANAPYKVIAYLSSNGMYRFVKASSADSGGRTWFRENGRYFGSVSASSTDKEYYMNFFRRTKHEADDLFNKKLAMAAEKVDKLAVRYKNQLKKLTV